MKSFSSSLLAFAALGAARSVESTPTAQKGSAVAADCLADFNTIREKAGLDPFIAEDKVENKMPISADEYIEAICAALQEGVSANEAAAKYTRTGTYAYAPQTDSSEGCSAAVSFWKGAHVNFGDLPVEYTKENIGVYGDSRNRSFVALFNPNEGATIDCAYITCTIPSVTSTTTPATTAVTTKPTQSPTTSDQSDSHTSTDQQKDQASSNLGNGENDSEVKPPATPSPDGEKSGSQQPSGSSVRRLSTSTETVTSLVCLTNPAALVDNEKPFSEDVWLSIKEAIENSASSSMQSSLLAIALLLLTSFIIF